MRRNGWILLLVLICVAFFVSCGKKNQAEDRQGELVKTETVGNAPMVFCFISSKIIDLISPCWYNLLLRILVIE